jgi:hypothetical protein
MEIGYWVVQRIVGCNFGILAQRARSSCYRVTRTLVSLPFLRIFSQVFRVPISLNSRLESETGGPVSLTWSLFWRNLRLIMFLLSLAQLSLLPQVPRGGYLQLVVAICGRGFGGQCLKIVFPHSFSPLSPDLRRIHLFTFILPPELAYPTKWFPQVWRSSTLHHGNPFW